MQRHRENLYTEAFLSHKTPVSSIQTTKTGICVELTVLLLKAYGAPWMEVYKEKYK